jgi:hypothetical protein
MMHPWPAGHQAPTGRLRLLEAEGGLTTASAQVLLHLLEQATPAQRLTAPAAVGPRLCLCQANVGAGEAAIWPSGHANV